MCVQRVKIGKKEKQKRRKEGKGGRWCVVEKVTREEGRGRKGRKSRMTTKGERVI